MKIELDAPNVGELEKTHINQAIESGFISTFGPFVPKFEDKMAGYLGIEKATATQSGTAALHMALYELGISKGDEVIVPALTFIGTVNPVLYLGAKPVFVDVDCQTWNICPADIERNITKKTKAIIPVHLYGNPCYMDKIVKIARKNNLYIIEDAAESLGAVYQGKHTGTFGDMGCFSFNGNKTITTGGGGMVVSKNIKAVEHIKFLVNQAKDAVNSMYHPEVGFNYRMSNLEAALGLAQMERLEMFLEKKREFNYIYRGELKTVSDISFQKEYKGAESSWWLSCVVFQNQIDIATLQKRLKQKGIPTRRIFMPIVEFPPYKEYRQQDYRNSYYIFNKGLSLPSSTLNSRDDIYYVCKVIKDVI